MTKRIERWVWYVFLATCAWQTRMIFWHAGLVFTEWQAVAVWLSDVLMISLFVLAAVRGWRPKVRGNDWFLVAFIGAAALSLLHARSVFVGGYQVVRLVQYGFLYLYILQWARERFRADTSALIFIFGALVQSVLAIAQYVLQRDVGLRWIGETLLRVDMHGVAVFVDTHGDKILRAYGTLPHPNILAAYLVVAWWCIVWLWSVHPRHAAFSAMLFVVVAALELTFARTVIAVWLAGVFGYLIWTKRWTALRLPLAVTAATLIVVSVLCWSQVWARLTIHSSDEAVQQRLDYARDALHSGGGLLSLNWIGVGIGNFTMWLKYEQPNLPDYLVQPAHSAYLLAYSETGILGLALWLVWLVSVIRSGWRSPMTVVVLTLLLIAANDHFTWTLQQGRILWWGILGFYV